MAFIAIPALVWHPERWSQAARTAGWPRETVAEGQPVCSS